jgi:hypothetical protein
MPIDFLTIAFYLTALSAFTVLHVVLVTLSKPRVRYAPDPQGPRCQGCGYILFAGLPQLCPECGRNAERDRILQKSPPRPVPPIAPFLGAALLLFPITIVAGYPLAARLPQSWRGQARYDIPTPAGNVFFWLSVRGRGSDRKLEGNEISFPTLPQSRHCYLNTDSMTLNTRHYGPVAADCSGVLGLLNVPRIKEADAASLASAYAIVAELQSLRNNAWPEDRFQYEMTGTYLITPDDDRGPFFWLPTYAPACIPLWILLITVIALCLRHRHRAAMKLFEAQPAARS